MSDLSGNLASASSDTAGAILSLTVLAHTLTRQPNFPATDIAQLQALNTHLATAKGHANDWINKYSGQLWDTLQGLVSFGETFGNLYDGLMTAAQQMANESSFAPNEIAKLVAQLQALQTLVQAQHSQGSVAYTALTNYSDAVSADYAVFATDFNTANLLLGGAQGDIARRQAKIEAEHAAMSKDLGMIGGGAAMMVVGILIIAVGALLEGLTAGQSTWLVVGGVVVVAGGAAMTGVAGKDYDDKMADIAADQLVLAAESRELSQLTGVKVQINSLNTTLGHAQAVLGNLVTGWQQLDNAIAAVVTDLQAPEAYLETIRKTQPNATPATVALIISAEIKTAGQDWATAVQLAKAYLDKSRNVVNVDTGDKQPTQAEIAKVASQGAKGVAAVRLGRAGVAV